MKESPEQEDDMFRRFAADVTPLKSSNRAHPTSSPRALIPRDTLLKHPISDTLSDHGAPETSADEYLSNGLSRMTLRKLRRGEWPPQATLDLHGSTTEQARKLLLEFLQEALQDDLRCVSVIHGKGWRSENREGVLKNLTRHWLSQHTSVLAFCEPPPQAGGGGAVWVLLKVQRAESAPRSV